MGSAFYEVSLLTTTVSGACIFFFKIHAIWRFFSACMHDEVALGLSSSSSSPSFSVMIDNMGERESVVDIVTYFLSQCIQIYIYNHISLRPYMPVFAFKKLHFFELCRQPHTANRLNTRSAMCWYIGIILLPMRNATNFDEKMMELYQM
jgi:hypothetical protein